jgi:succinoglycan biosynthesis transport protein ExoP
MSDSRKDRFEVLAKPAQNGHPTTPDSEQGFTIADYLQPLRRRWWVVAVCAVIAVAGAWWALRSSTPVYTAEVMLQTVESESMSGLGIFSGVETMDVGSQLEIMRSRAVISEVVDSLDLRLGISTEGARRTRLFEAIELEPDAPIGGYILARVGSTVELRNRSDESTMARVPAGQGWLSGPGFRVLVSDSAPLREPVDFYVTHRDGAIARLSRTVRIEPGRGPGILRIRYSSPDPVLAAAVVNTMAESYVAYNTERGRESAGRRREFLSGQLAQLADSLRRAQDAMLEYQEREGMFTPGTEGGALSSALITAENEQRSLRFEESLLQSVLAAVSSEGGGEGLERIMVLGQEVLPGGAGLYNRLQGLEADRARLTASRFGYTASGPEVEVIDSLIANTRTQIASVAEQAQELLSAKIAENDRRLGELRAEVGVLPQRNAQLAALQQRVDAVQNVFDLLVGKYYEAQIAEAVESGGVQVVDPAPVPRFPDSSGGGLSLSFALLAGLLVGAGGAFGLDRLDTSLRTARQAERATRLPVLGLIPKVSTDGTDMLAGVEAFRSLRTNLQFAYEGLPSILTITSAAPREGKSTIASNLALIFGQQGSRVLLVDGDLRRPRLHAAFNDRRYKGLTDVLDGKLSLEQVVRSDVAPGVSLLPAGRPMENASELLGGKRFALLLNALRSKYDVVIVDSPPILAVADPKIISRHGDGTLIVARADLTDIPALEDAVDQLRRLDVPIMGLVLNEVPRKGSYRRYGYYEYGEYYSGDGAGFGKKSRRGVIPSVVRTGGKSRGGAPTS